LINVVRMDLNNVKIMKTVLLMKIINVYMICVVHVIIKNAMIIKNVYFKIRKDVIRNHALILMSQIAK
jgi:hypothetical protein